MSIPGIFRFRGRLVRLIVVILAASFVGCGEQSRPPDASLLTSFPFQIDRSCRAGSARLYDECSDQIELFEEALAQANIEEKTLLVSFGAEWCIWCHVFESYIRGEREKFRYTYASPDDPDDKSTSVLHERARSDVSAEADKLRDFVSENFVLVHIDAEYAPRGWDVLEKTGAWEAYEDFIPFVFTVDHDGRYAATFNHDDVEIRRDGFIDWYRGYDRGALLSRLDEMKQAAVGQP